LYICAKYKHKCLLNPRHFKDLLIFEPQIIGDKRGYFYESYNQIVFKEAGIENVFIQDNQSYSQKGVLRGLHYQLNPYAQAKLVRVIQGSVLDVVVDLRKNSSTYSQNFSIVLSGENNLQMLVPRGFAHGYLVLEDNTIFTYKCDNLYSRIHERGLLYNDPELNINWQCDLTEVILSEKDTQQPLFKDAEFDF
jgi:dTDP-4-dehydrorhamnose 3,5-epimerase